MGETAVNYLVDLAVFCLHIVAAETSPWNSAVQALSSAPAGYDAAVAVHDAGEARATTAPAATAAAATFTTAAAAAASTTSRVCASYDDSSGNAAHATQTCFIAAAAATACAYASGKVRSPVLHSHSPNIWGSIYTI